MSGTDPHLALVFGSRAVLASGDPLAELVAAYPRAIIAGCSTAGEILDTQVEDDSLAVTEIRLDRSTVRLAHTELDGADDSVAAGRQVAEELMDTELVHILVFSDGLQVNGSGLARGMTEVLPASVQVTGGLAGDGEAFERTLTCAGASVRDRAVVAVGLYSSCLKVGYGSFGGWDPFGPERLITKSEGNVLFELDGRNALELYKIYLDEHALDLPASALLFPLSLRSQLGDKPGVVRTVLAVDEAAGTMTFAGDLPEGSYARFMKANFERLIDGAVTAAGNSQDVLGVADPQLALLISCVGRRMVLGQRVEEELESVREVVGPGPAMTGFYSYGEIAPFSPSVSCELHNQTMTITLLSEG